MSAIIEQCVKEERIKYYEFNEFSRIEEIGSETVGKVYRAIWKQSENFIALKSFDLDNDIVEQIVYEIKLQQVDFNDAMIKFYGITKTDSTDPDNEYLLVMEYAEGGTLRSYLKENFSSLNWQDKYGLAFQLSSAVQFLHEKGIVHKDLHSNNIFIQQNSIKLADSGLSKRIKDTRQISSSSFDTIPYIDPQGINITRGKSPGGDRLKKSDVYSVGVLLWELSSGKKPFANKEYDLSLAMEIAQGLRESVVEGTLEKYSKIYTRCWDGDPDKRPTIQEVVVDLSSQQIIQHFKSNRGLFLDGYRIEPSKQAVFSEDGELSMIIYEGQPFVYTFTNDHNSRTNLLRFNSDDNSTELNENLQPSDVCINFPVAEVTYNANLLESFSNFMGDGEKLHKIYGHLFARKILVGGKLFIDDLTSATSTQIDTFKSLLTWVYNSAKYGDENPFNNLSALDFFPKVRTSNGEKFNVLEELINWMNNLYQKNMADIIISYNNLIPISQLRDASSSEKRERRIRGAEERDTQDEIQPGVANFKEKLSLEEWVGDSIYVKLTRWVKEFRLLRGQIINDHFEFEISKKISVKFINVPNVDSIDEFYLEMINPTTLEEFLIANNILSAKYAKNISSFPFNKRDVVPDDLNYGDYTYFRAKYERYKISWSKDDIKPSEEFKHAIEKALKSMKPFVDLQNVFDEYGNFFPLSIVMGNSLKNILPNNSSSNNSSERIDFESLNSRLDNLKISYLLTQKGSIIEKKDLSNWIQKTKNTNNDLEIIEFDDIITLDKILEIEQQRMIDVILNKQDNSKVIMTGIIDLKDLDNSSTKHYKRINVEPSLEDENYEVFGSIISKDNLKIEDFFVAFGSYDFNGFSATINKLSEINVNIKECYILWAIIGIPTKLLVFSPKNRELQVDSIEESIKLQPDNPYYSIKTSCRLSQGDTIAYCSTTNYKPINVKLVGWSKNCINFQLVDNDDQLDDTEVAIIDMHIRILSSNSSDDKSLKIDNQEMECYLGLIGYVLTEINMVFDFTKIFSNNEITVKFIDNPLSQSAKSVRLNLTDNLLIVRQELERRNIMNETLSFAHKFSNNSDNEFSEIALEDEEDFRLDEIVCESGNDSTLYLAKRSKVDNIY